MLSRAAEVKVLLGVHHSAHTHRQRLIELRNVIYICVKYWKVGVRSMGVHHGAHSHRQCLIISDHIPKTKTKNNPNSDATG